MTLTYRVNNFFNVSNFAQGLTAEINSKWAYNAVYTNENVFCKRINVSAKGVKYTIRILFEKGKLAIDIKNAGTLSHIATTAAVSALCLFTGSKNITRSLALSNRRHYKNQGKYKDQLDDIVSIYSANYLKNKEV